MITQQINVYFDAGALYQNKRSLAYLHLTNDTIVRCISIVKKPRNKHLWLCYYKALQDGQASVVVPIDKLSILVMIAFSYFVLKEKLTKKALLGLVLMTAGTLMLVK